MPWQEQTMMSLKEDFIRRALIKEEPFSLLCRRFNITRKTGYRILNRYRNEGPGGLIPKSKRPHSSPNQTNPKIEEAIIKLRLKQPTWGARKLIKYLSNKGLSDLPSPSTVTQILKRNNMISIEESMKRQKLIRFEKEHPNELWQMDFKGYFQLLTKERCYPLTIIDDHSRFSLTIKACKNERHDPVKTRLIHVFKKYGLPNQINVDNGNPWGNSSLLPYTTLSVWLMRLGVWMSHSRPRHPQTNGKCERFHRTLKNDLICRHPMRTFSHAQKLFDQWREQYNHERPHEAIEMEVPAARYQASQRQMPNQLPQLEYDIASTLRKVRGNGYISFDGGQYLVGEAFKGNFVKVEKDEANQCINVYFGPFKIYMYDI